MNGICGWSGREQHGNPEDILRQMTSSPSPNTLASNQGALAAERGGAATLDGVLAAISGHPSFIDTQLAAITKREGPASALAHGYLDRGEMVLQTMGGAFSLAILDTRQGSALLATDRSGINPMAYSLAGNTLVFGSTLDALNRHPLVKREINHQAIYNYVYFHMIPGPGSIYKGQERLLPGQCLVFRDGAIEVKSYWEMRFEENVRLPFSELKDEFLATLGKAVADAAEGAETGAFLSGGTDSSTLAGMLGKALGRPAKTYSIGFEADGYDEMEYARIAAKHFGTDHHEYYVTPCDVASAIPEIAAAYDQPFGNSSAVPTYYCAKLAKADGMERLLGGDGGDELFGGNERYAKQRIFSFYEDIPMPLRKGLIEPLAHIPGGNAIMPLRKLRSYVDQASIPLPARLETYNLLERLGPSNVFTDDFLGKIDPGVPIALLGDVYHNAHAQTQLNRMLALDLKFTLADNDLPKVVTTCKLAGLDVGFPMLDEHVVAFSAKLDPELKLKGTRLRYFFKEALRGFLPDAILTKSKHGFGLPFGEWLRTSGELRALAQDSLDTLKGRGIIRAEFVDELIRLHQIHSGYYGTMIWVLMMLEQWFRSHGDSA